MFGHHARYLTHTFPVGMSILPRRGGSSPWAPLLSADRKSNLTSSPVVPSHSIATFHAMQHGFQDPSRFIPSYAVLSRIRVSSSTNVVESAERVIQTILNTYSEPNLPPEKFLAWAGERNDPLREFGNICRHELESLWDGL